jgi:hypothetical protein
MIDRIKNDIFFDEELNPYTENQINEELQRLICSERYEDCLIIKEHLNRFKHDENYISERTETVGR